MADLPAKPASREEEYLASIAGMAAEVPPCPRSRKEAYLDAINQRAEDLQSDVDELNDKVTALATDFSYKGSVETAEDLPANPAVGDVYTVADTGEMQVWDGENWQTLNFSGSSVNVVQTTGTSTTDVMSQNAVTSMVFADPATRTRIQIGSDSSTSADRGIAIGKFAEGTGTSAVAIGGGSNIYYHTVATGGYSVAIGSLAQATSAYATAIGHYSEARSYAGTALGNGAKTSQSNQIAIGTNQANANVYGGEYDVFIGYKANGTSLASSSDAGGSVALGKNSTSGRKGSIALGSYSKSTQQGEMNIGSTDTSYGYNSSNYRLLTGLYDGQSDHDACTVGQLNAAVGDIESALNVINNGTGA